MGLPLTSTLLLVLVSTVACEQVLGTYNVMLDPGRITVWKTKWLSGQIELSQTSQGAKNVTVTFYFTPSTTFTNGVFEVTFPSSFDLSVLAASGAALSVSGQVVQFLAQLTAAVDSTISIPFVGLPAATGPYGPFALRTRTMSTGQIIDINLAFGEVYITASESPMTALAVSFAGKSSNIINRAGNTLSFKFTVTKELWVHDWIRIAVAPQFTLKNPVCRSVEYLGQANALNGTRAADPGLMDCIVSSATGAQVLWIYGLNIDLLVSDSSPYFASLEVSGFTNPDRDYPASAYSWRIDTLRFNTRNILEYAIVSGPETTNDNLYTASWVPTWGRPVTSILREQTLFMDLTFTTVNRIPAGGKIVVETSADSATWGINDEFRCYVVTFLSATVTCQQSVGITTITGLSGVAPATEVTFRTLSKFTTLSNALAEEIKSISTMSAEGYLIDVGSALARFTLPPNSKAVSAGFDTFLEDSAGSATMNKAGGSGDSTQFVKFRVSGLAYNDAGGVKNRLSAGNSIVTISCPISAQADDLQINIPAKNLYKQYKTSGTTRDFSTATVMDFPSAGYDAAGGSALSITSGSISKTKLGRTIYTAGTVVFTAGTNQVVNEFTIGLSVGKISGLPQVVNSGAIVLPRVASSAASAYECSLDIIDSTGTLIPVRGSTQFDIDYQVFSQRGFTYFCTAGNIAGAPVKVTILPNVVDLYPSVASRTYYLDLILSVSDYTTYVSGVSTFHASGAVEGDFYPVDSSLTTVPTMTVTTDGKTDTFTHRVTGLGNIAPQSSALELFFPVGKAKKTQLLADPNKSQPSLAFKTFYTLTDDPRVRYYTHSDKLQSSELYTIDLVDNSGTQAFSPKTVSNGDSGVAGDVLSPTLSLGLPIQLSGDSYFYVILPRGFSFAATKGVSTDTPTAANFAFVKYFPAPNLRFSFPGLLVKVIASGLRITSTTASGSKIQLIGLQSALGAASSDLTVVHSDYASQLASYCYLKSTITLTTVTGTMTGVYVAPKEIPARGADGTDISHTVVFTLVHGIDLGGSIVLSVNPLWSTNEYTSCVVRGLDPATSGGSLSCSRSGNDFTITNFADFRSVRGMPVTVFLQHLSPPSNTKTTTLSLQLISALYSRPSQGSGNIDKYDPGANDLITIRVANVAPVPTYQKVKIWPNHAGVTDSDLYLAYTFRNKLPARTKLAITFPTKYTSASTCSATSSQVYMNSIRYRACGCTFSSSGSTVVGFYVVLDQDLKEETTLELFLDHALDPPSATFSQSSSSADGFFTVASWFDTIIATDTTTYRTEQLTLAAAKAGTISQAGTRPLWITPTTSYEAAAYSFTFKVSVAVAATDRFVIVFPDQFDAFLGNSEQLFASEVGNFYLSCSSTQLKSTFCKSDHWLLVVTFANAVTSGTQVSLTVTGVRNPAAGTTGNFKIFHENSAGVLLEQAAAFGQVTITALPKQIDVKSLKVAATRLSFVADYSFSLFMTDSFLSTTQLDIAFPSEYDLKLVDQKSSYPCLSNWVDHAPAAKTLGPQDWNENKVCTAKGNIVTLPPPTDGIGFVQTSEVRLTLKGVMTPQWAQSRYPTGDDRDFDDTDSDVWPIWSFWTGQFKVFVYQQDSLRVTSRAYSSLNAAYLGFTQPLRTVSVNDYSPLSKSNRILVYPGTQTADIPIKLANATMPLEAKMLQFRPSTNKYTPDYNKLKYSSYSDDWKMLHGEWLIHFRVAADLTLAKGLYYISWKVDESRQPGVEHPAYALPFLTLVEVPAVTPGVISFQVAAIPPVAVGSSNIPIKVSLPNPPHTEVILNILLQNPISTVIVDPSSLTFRSDLDFQYFNITVLPGHDYTTVAKETLLFTIGGRDAVAFSVAPSVDFSITENFSPTFGNIAKMGIDQITRTSFTIAPATDQLGIVYYQVSPKGSKLLSYSTMRAQYLSLTTSDLQLQDKQEKNVQQRVREETWNAQPPGSTWDEYMHQLYAQHMTSFQTGGMIVMARPETSDPVLIDGLYAGSDYQVASYFDNNDPSSTGSSMRLEYVTTSAIADCQPVSLLFDGFVSNTQQERVRNLLAKYVGVNPSRLQEAKYFNIAPRYLQGNMTSGNATEFQYTLVAHRSQNVPTPFDQTNLSPQQQSDLTSDLLDTLGLKLTSYSQLSSRTRTKPLWVQTAQVATVTNTSVTVRYNSNANGQACCVALGDSNSAIVPDQVVEGYSYNWTKVPAKCGATAAGVPNTLKITGMKADEIYYVYCVLTDDYPLWPTQMEYSAQLSMSFIPVHTPSVVEVEIELLSVGWILSAALFWLISL